MTLDEADQIIAELNICFPSKKLLVEEVKRWEQNLEPFHFEDAKVAVKHIEDTLRFFPAWADFREAIWPLAQERSRKDKSRVLEASRGQYGAPATEEQVQAMREIIEKIKNQSRRWM